MGTQQKRAGRPAGVDGNKEKILGIAREQFAAKGFRGTTMRSIAAQAGFDVALVAHYFGSKDGLFAATVVQLPAGFQEMLLGALSAPEETQGERLTRGYLGLWESPETGEQMLALIRGALGNELVRERIREFMTKIMAGPQATEMLQGRLVGWSLAMTHLLGVAIGRHLAKAPLITAIDFETLVKRVAPAVQMHLSTREEHGVLTRSAAAEPV